MKRIFILFAVLLFFTTCKSPTYLSEDFKLEGVFVNKEKKWLELQFDKNNFVYYDNHKQIHMNPIVCCDTLSYGTWKIDSRGFAMLNTPIDLDIYMMKSIKVVERKDFSADSIYFIINNPIEEFYTKNKWNTNDVSYKIFVITQDGFYDLPKKKQMIFTNKIVALAENKKIKGFDITALINPEFQYMLNNTVATLLVKTEPYAKKDLAANVFEVYIPDVSFEFLSLKRLKDDYVKIINRNKLLWDGKEYIRKR